MPDDDMVSIEVVMTVRMPKDQFDAWAEREGINKRQVRGDIRRVVHNFVSHIPLIDEANATVELRKGAHNA